MKQYKIHIPDISCEHCVASIHAALTKVENLTIHRIDLEEKIAHITAEIGPEMIAEIIYDIGFEVEQIVVL